MNKKQQGFTLSGSKGFTLIELLVVIAIIGILASIVLVSLSNARAKAVDTRVKSNIGQLRTMAELISNDKGHSYDTVDNCFTTPILADCGNATTVASVATIQADLTTVGSTLSIGASTATAYCVSATLLSDTAQSVCSDSTGVTKITTGICPTSGTPVCP